MPRATHNVQGLVVHPKDSKYDYSFDMRIHIKAYSLEDAINRAERVAALITRRIPWAYLVVKKWKEPKA